MSFWNNQENNAIKVIIITLFVAGSGYFVYNSVHENSLDNLGQVVPVIRKNPGTRGGGSDTSKCIDTSAGIALNSMLAGTSPMTIVSTAASTAVNIPWMTFRLSNPSDCPVDVSRMSFLLTTNEVTSWPPVQNLKLVNVVPSGSGPVAVQLDGMKEVAGGVLPDEPIIPVPVGSVTPSGAGSSTLTFVYNFPGASSVRIAPRSTAVFRLIGNSQNIPANMYGYDGTPGSGNEVFFKLQLVEFTGTPALGGSPLSQTVAAGTIPATITTPTIKVHY